MLFVYMRLFDGTISNSCEIVGWIRAFALGISLQWLHTIMFLYSGFALLIQNEKSASVYNTVMRNSSSNESRRAKYPSIIIYPKNQLKCYQTNFRMTNDHRSFLQSSNRDL